MVDLTALSDTEITGLTIVGEARGERIEGQVGVGSIIRNRLHSQPTKYQNYYSVCLEHKQFSCWNDDDVNRPYLMDLAERLITGLVLTDLYIRQCMYVAQGIVFLDILDNTHLSLFYMEKNLFASDKRPKWARLPKKDSILIGNHIFFNV